MLSVESVGTLPCSPEIPDCVEQVRAVDGLCASCAWLSILLAIGTGAWLCGISKDWDFPRWPSGIKVKSPRWESWVQASNPSP